MKQPIKMTPGDDLHLTMLMAPHSLNLAVGQFRQQLLGYGRAAFEAGKAGQCLHQIQERAGLSVSNAETIEAVIDERDAFMRWYSDALKAKGPWDKSIHFAFDAWQARAALAADPAAAQGGEHG